MIKNIIKLFRIEQYIKNFFIFAPLFFSFQFTFTNFISALLAFLLFSLMASSVYILNDIFDVKEDVLHPNKKIRPIASNLITTNTAYFLSILLAIIALMGSYILNINIFYVLIIYLSINILYSAKLKYIPIIDIIIIAFGFVLRLFVGGYAINEMITNWIIALTFILSIFIALAKRREDIQLLLDGKETRRNVRFYNIEILNQSLKLLSVLIILIYLLFTLSPEVIIKFTDKIYMTIIFVIIGLYRYLYLTLVKNHSGDPTKIFLTDRILQTTIIAWLLSFYYIAKAM
tara:strand:- start:49 stop:912 length:864 start_codon:yes stop_codon:yes gene_type:complete